MLCEYKNVLTHTLDLNIRHEKKSALLDFQHNDRLIAVPNQKVDELLCVANAIETASSITGFERWTKLRN